MLIGIILATVIVLLVILGLIFGVPGVIVGCIVLVIAAGIAVTLISARNAKKNPVVKIEIVNEVKEGNHSLVTFRETYADGNAGIKLIRSNSANYALELATMQTLENAKSKR